MSVNKNKIVQLKAKKNKNTTGNPVLKWVGFAIVVLALLGLIFSSVFYSTGSGAKGPSLIFGRYGKINIEYSYDNDFGRAVEQEMAKYNNAVQDEKNDMYKFIRYLAWQQAFNQVVVKAAMQYDLEKSGYSVSPRAIDRMIINNDASPYRTDGKFDEEKYLEDTPDNKNRIRRFMKEKAMQETWYKDVLDGQKHPSGETSFLKEMRSPVNTYNYVSISYSAFPEEKVISYGMNNSKLFRKMPVSRIMVGDKDTAEKVINEYNQNKQDIEEFSKLAGEYSIDSYKDKGGSMGSTYYFKLVDFIGAEDTDKIFSKKEGELAGPFETSYGWVVFRSDGDIINPEISSITEDVRNYIEKNEIGLIEDTLTVMTDKIKVKVIAGSSFADAALSEGFEVKTTAPFPFNYGGDILIGGSPEDTDDPAMSGTSKSDDFWKKIIPLKNKGEVSDSIVLNSAVGIFSLAESAEAEPPQYWGSWDYWDSYVKYETASSLQTDYQVAVLNTDSKIFKNNFTETYKNLFGEN